VKERKIAGPDILRFLNNVAEVLRGRDEWILLEYYCILKAFGTKRPYLKLHCI
jgi:hypothetical protein